MSGRTQLDLTVDLVRDAAEVARFNSKVVRDPAPGGCWYWTGAIGDDGYGRFWIHRSGEHERMIRANRYAVALAVGYLPAEAITLHECDEPICMRAEDPTPHVVTGTQAENLATMGRRGRGGGHGFRHGQPDRAFRAVRSKAIREALRNGWNSDALTAALVALTAPDQHPLF